MAGRTTADGIERGRALFNAGRYFEAHEAWEEVWLEERTEARTFLQGLIQIAAAFHKAFVQGQPGGCVRLLEAGLSKLEGDSPSVFAMKEFVERVQGSLEAARRWQRGEVAGLDSSSVPRLELQRSVRSK